uniref:Zgc:152968 n=1 Tax=Salmo trutta TaxID=8032 RepID=A0A673XJB1_SALTR
MLSSIGFFAEIDCPFFRRDHCKRPHCLYKHDKDERGMFDNTLYGSPVTAAGQSAKDPCLLELERINKEIETVKNEVEKEQRRLSRYQTVQVDSERTGSKKVLIAKSETPGKDLNGNSVKSSHRQSTTVNSPARRKYVVDNSKPRTDLEYDPLSNFSASLKRVAHVSRYNEPPVGKSKAQVIVPFRGGAPQLSNPSKIQQLQQRASVLSAALKGGQASHQATHHPVQYLIHQPTHQTTMQNSCVNVIPVGTAIQVGNNLHFILPEGSYTLPITSANSPVTLVHTPVHTPVTPVPVQPQPTAYIPAKLAFICFLKNCACQGHFCYVSQPIPTKRKAKMRPEVSAKVPHDVRQRYVNLFVEEFLKTSVTVQDAFEKALAEEKTVYDRSINKLKYLSVAVNALKRLKNQSSVSVKAGNETYVQLSKGNIPLNEKALWANGDVALYDSLKEHILSEEILTENNYPLQHPEKSGSAVLYREDYKKGITDRERRVRGRSGMF